SQTTNFSVSVADSQGKPIPDLQISCDSEAGVAIIDPALGTSITGDFGGISGQIGCAAPGSWRFVCRTPTGANIRDSITIHCTGDFPEGFTGFTGAAGGGLGNGTGGVANQGGQGDGSTGGTDISGASVTSLTVYDDASPTNTIDITLDECNENFAEDMMSEPEEFGDATFEVTIVNNSNQLITIDGYSITVPQATGSGTATYNSGNISALLEVPPNGTERTLGEGGALPLAFSAGTGKRYAGAPTSTIPAIGFRNVTIRFTGFNDLGQEVTLAASVGLNFVNELNCGS
ncbi:MAG: hypothetical protein KDD53_01190, partial [Bdellovibrionales bacterium]|nr:hypothetical protein [Bdellovibrionales bacterium]